MNRLLSIIKSRDAAKREAPPRLPAVSVKNRKEYFYGRKEEVKAILDLLSNQKSTHGGGKVQVVHITGKAGVGKTALAGLIYSHPQVVKSFQLRVWVDVPQKTSVCGLVKKIIEIVTDTDDQEFSPTQSNDLQLLLPKLELCFAGKRFLLVLDNCWIVDSDLVGRWNLVFPRLGITGSAIILTPVPDQVFVLPADHHSVPLGLLPVNDCDSIFWNHAQPSVVPDRWYDEDPQPELKDVGLQILEKMGDQLALAAKMIGSFLQDKDLDAWTRTLRDELLSTKGLEKSNIPLFMILCFLDLHVVLILCLGFLSIYPKGYRFKQKQVVYLWMALGFLNVYERGSKSSEEVGNGYVSYLTWRSFIHPSSDGVSFIIHDLVHDLASCVFNMSTERKHVLYYGNTEVFKNFFDNPDVSSTILPRGLPDEEVRELSEVHVLSLSRAGITELAPSIAQLSDLCYLDLSYTALHALPDFIADLRNLQTLLLTNCTSLTSLPDTLSNLTNLLYLDIRGTRVQDMPPNMNRLTSLETLTNFVVSRSSPRFQDLAGLSNIKTLAISNLHNVRQATEVSYAKLKEKTNLNDLTLQWVRGHDYLETESKVLEILVPPGNIKTLTVEHYYSPEFPIWLGDELFRTLRSVKLHYCNCISLPPLGQLPCLEHLVIEGLNKVTRVDAEFCGWTGDHKPFQFLKSLQFREMLKWKEWNNVEDIEFRYLRELSFMCCPSLVRALPRKLNALEKLEISGCYNLVDSLPLSTSAYEVCVHESSDILMRSADKATIRRQHVIVPVEGKEFTPPSYSAADSLVTDTPDTTDYSQMATSSSEDEGSSFEMLRLRVSNISQLENKLPRKLDGLRIEECTNLVSLPVSLQHVMPTLQELYLIDCYSFKSFPSDAFPISLRTLYVINCPKLELFSSSKSKHKFKSLKYLSIGCSCDSLSVFPLDFFPKLKTLSLWDCSNLSSFTISVEFQEDLASLESLEIRDCPNLKSLGLPTPKLASILVSNCKNLNNIPNFKNSFLPSLESLVLRECPSLESLLLEALPSSLTSLSIAFCNKLTPLKSWGLHNLGYLSSFDIEGEYIDMESFPEEGLLPGNINTLRMSRFKSLKKLDNNGFQNLKALQALEINGSNKLESLPEPGSLPSLTYLCIKECPLLTQKLLSKAPEEWSKVAHIPRIQIDGEKIC